MSNARFYVSVGDLAVCSTGRIGEVEEFKRVDGSTVAVGTGLDGKSWQSKVPVKVDRIAAQRVQRRMDREACRCG